jgi:osmotically inducible protein OsmC
MWEGTLKEGNGRYEAESGTVQGAYTWKSRFGEGGASNPEELLAAAEASCFSMALSGSLDKNGTPSTSISTDAACTVEKVGDAWQITTIVLDVKASVANIDDAKFQEIAKATLVGCPVSKALNPNVKLEINAKLV